VTSPETRRNAPDDEEDELTIRGEVHASSVPELLRSLLRSNETGILTFRRDEVTKRLFVHDGRVVYAVSTNPEERLGENLMVRGKISARQYLEASKRVRPGQRLGAILVEMGALDAEDLVPAVEAQVRELLMDLLTWTHGDYEFVIRDAAPDNPVTVDISTHGLVLDGIRRTRAWSRVLRGIGGDIETVFTLTGENDVLRSLELTGDEQEVLARVNGRSSVEQICQVSYLSNFETCRTLWALAVLGVIRKAQPGEAAVDDRAVREEEMELEGIVERYNQVFNRVYTFLRGRVGDEVDAFMDASQEELAKQFAALLDGVDLKRYGRADFEQMLANVAGLPVEQRKNLIVSALNELVFILQLGVHTRWGTEEQAVVSGIIKEGFRKPTAPPAPVVGRGDTPTGG
jgi:uncharacterized protein with GYD domain